MRVAEVCDRPVPWVVDEEQVRGIRGGSGMKACTHVIAQCWCGAIYETSEQLVKHWADVVKAGESVMDHVRGEGSVLRGSVDSGDVGTQSVNVRKMRDPLPNCWTSRHLHVSVEVLDSFTGWLEFAGHDVPGVAVCHEWPPVFRAQRLAECCTAALRYGITCWLISAPSWPEPARFVFGEWDPTFYLSEEHPPLERSARSAS